MLSISILQKEKTKQRQKEILLLRLCNDQTSIWSCVSVENSLIRPGGPGDPDGPVLPCIKQRVC